MTDDIKAETLTRIRLCMITFALAMAGGMPAAAAAEFGGMPRARWVEALRWMVKEQEMKPLPAVEADLVLDYLAKYHGPDRLARKLSGRK